MKYFGEDFLVDGGCNAKDETVLRWHKFCSSIHGNSTLCIRDTFGKIVNYGNLKENGFFAELFQVRTS